MERPQVSGCFGCRLRRKVSFSDALWDFRFHQKTGKYRMTLRHCLHALRCLIKQPLVILLVCATGYTTPFRDWVLNTWSARTNLLALIFQQITQKCRGCHSNRSCDTCRAQHIECFPCAIPVSNQIRVRTLIHCSPWSHSILALEFQECPRV